MSKPTHIPCGCGGEQCELEAVYEMGVADTKQRIIKLLEDRKALLENPNNHYITAMNIPVTKESAMAITDATIWLIKGETNE